MSLISLFIIYSLSVIAASLLGGKLPSLVHLTHTRTQLIMSFVAGLMLGVACYHLLPHAIVTMGGAEAVDRAVWWLMIGLLFMFVLLRVFHFHQHEQVEELVQEEIYESDNSQHDHHHDHSHHHHDHHHHDHHHHDHHHASTPAAGSTAHPLSWLGVAAGLTLHTFIDGVALGAAIQADATTQAHGLFSVGVFLAILLHKPLDSMSITSLMHNSGYSDRVIRAVNFIFALMCPLGALLFFWGIGAVGDQQSQLIGAALAFSAGVFLCISLSDILPELQFHSHDRVKLTIVLVLGIALAYGICYLEPDHAHALHEEAAEQHH